jgi:DNA primase catalytic core
MDYLLQHAGLGGGKYKLEHNAHKPKVREEAAIKIKKEVDSKLIKTILEFSQKNLVRKNNEVLAYLKKERGYSQDTIKKMELGYINSKAALGAYLRKLGFSNDKVKEAYTMLHLIGKSHTLIIPYKDKEGNPVGFAGRNINHDVNSNIGKYLYTKGLSINSTLLNIHNVKKGAEIIVVEGVLDCLHAYAKGISNIVALGGTGFNKNQLKLLEEKKITTVNLCLDNDNAGAAAREKIAKEIVSHLPHISIRQSTLPGNIKDPDQMLREHGLPAFKKVLDSAKQIKLADKIIDSIEQNPYHKPNIELHT